MAAMSLTAITAVPFSTEELLVAGASIIQPLNTRCSHRCRTHKRRIPARRLRRVVLVLPLVVRSRSSNRHKTDPAVDSRAVL